MDAPKRTALKMTTGYESNWYGVVTSEHDDDPTTVEYILATEHARIVAEKDARIADLEAQRAKMNWERPTLEQLTNARRDAFEEAAKMAEGFNPSASYDVEYRTNNIAAAIRDLAEKG